MCYESELKNSTKCQVHTLTRRWTCYGGNGGTEIENLDWLSDLGMTEMDESVRPKRTKKFWKFKSMMNQGLRVLLTQSGSNLTWSNFVM